MPWSLLQRAAIWLGSRFLSKVFLTSPARDPVLLPAMEAAQCHPSIVPISLASLLSGSSEWSDLRPLSEEIGCRTVWKVWGTELGARAPCVDETRDSRLPGSSPAGRHQQPFPPATTRPRLSRTRHCHSLPNDEKPSDLPPDCFQIKRYFGDN